MRFFVYNILALLLMGVFLFGCSKDSDQTVETMNGEALKLAQAGQHIQALEKAKAALAQSEKESGPDHPETVMSLEILGLVYQAMGDSGNAEISFLRALSIAKKNFSPNSEKTAKIMGNLAGLYYAQNQYTLAISFYKQSLGILKEATPGDLRLDILRNNIELCEKMQNEAKDEGAQVIAESGIDGGGITNASSDVSEGIPPVNLVEDLVPGKVKDSMISQLAKQNIFISSLDPLPPVMIENRGMVFPYSAVKKGKDTDSTQKIVVLFAAIKNPQKPEALVFKQCRLISHTSYLAALENGGSLQLKKEIQEVFAGLYL